MAQRRVQVSDFVTILRSLFNVITKLSYVDKSVNQMRADITGDLSRITTVTTIAELTNIDSYLDLDSYEDPYQGKLLIINEGMDAWANTMGG
jgi:hypothetical protein